MLNVANIGCTYGETVLGRTSDKFVWEGVAKAAKYYTGAGFTVHAIVGQRLLNRCGPGGVSAELRNSLVIIPSRDEMHDNDDLSTLQEAQKLQCQFVDNDNYRDWPARLSDRPALRQWFQDWRDALHVAYYFDRFGGFTPLKDYDLPGCCSHRVQKSMKSSEHVVAGDFGLCSKK